jgi:hypothetical protein
MDMKGEHSYPPSILIPMKLEVYNAVMLVGRSAITLQQRDLNIPVRLSLSPQQTRIRTLIILI